MAVICRFIVDATDFALGRALGATTTRIDLAQFVPIDGRLVPYFWKVHGDDVDAFERSVREDPAVARLTDLDGRANATLYRVTWTDVVDGFLEALRTNEIPIETAYTMTGGSWTFGVRAPTQGNLSELQADCYDHDVRLDVRQLVHDGEDYHEGLVNVTDKQREALSLAFEEGYFDVPREVTLTELAEMIDISRQSFARRLQRAHKTIITNLLH